MHLAIRYPRLNTYNTSSSTNTIESGGQVCCTQFPKILPIDDCYLFSTVYRLLSPADDIVDICLLSTEDSTY